MKIYLTDKEVLELAVESLDLMQPNPDRLHEIAERMDMVYYEDLDLFEDVEEHSLRAYIRALKENQELKALCREVLNAREQYQFFVNGYANGSASISEANHAATVEHEAYSKLWDYLKKSAQ